MQIGVDTQRAVETKRALIVDSDDISAMALQFMLADELEVNIVATSADAGARTRAPDVILLGTSAMANEGAQVLGSLAVAFPGVPIIAFGPAADPAVALALAHGARSAIVRPFKVVAVRQRVNAQIGRRAVLAIPVVLGA